MERQAFLRSWTAADCATHSPVTHGWTCKIFAPKTFYPMWLHVQTHEDVFTSNEPLKATHSSDACATGQMASAPSFQQRRRSARGVGQIFSSSGRMWHTRNHWYTHIYQCICLLGCTCICCGFQLNAYLCIEYIVQHTIRIRILYCQGKRLGLGICTCNLHQVATRFSV